MFIETRLVRVVENNCYLFQTIVDSPTEYSGILCKENSNLRADFFRGFYYYLSKLLCLYKYEIIFK